MLIFIMNELKYKWTLNETNWASGSSPVVNQKVLFFLQLWNWYLFETVYQHLKVLSIHYILRHSLWMKYLCDVFRSFYLRALIILHNKYTTTYVYLITCVSLTNIWSFEFMMYLLGLPNLWMILKYR